MRPPELFRSVATISNPFTCDVERFDVPLGLTLREIFDVLPIEDGIRGNCEIFVGDQLIPREYWRQRPAAEAMVSIAAIPHGGGALRIIAFALVAVASVALIAVTAGAASPFIVGAGIAGSAAISVGGSILINTFIPPPMPQISKNYGTSSPTANIVGARNRPNYMGKAPFVLGTFRTIPPYSANPFREVIGGQIYFRALFAITHGPAHLDQIRIGTTDITQFQGVEYEIRRGYWAFQNKGGWNPATGVYPSGAVFGDQYLAVATGTIGGIRTVNVGETITYNGILATTEHNAWDINQEKPFSLFGNDIFEDALSASVKFGIPVVRTSKIGADFMSVEIVFDRGLVSLQNVPAGKPSRLGAAIRIEQAPTGTGLWVTVLETPIFGQSPDPLFWGYRWVTNHGRGVPDPNKQYDVRVTRLSADADQVREFSNFTWFALRTETVGLGPPIPGICQLAMRIKASGQLSGVLDEVNVKVSSMCKDYDAATGTWIWRITSMPPALYRHLLQHPQREEPATDGEIDISQLSYWDGVCRAKGFKFNGVYDSKTSVGDVLTDICRLGRAKVARPELIHSVTIDEPKTTPIRLFGPRNSFGYQGEISHVKGPDAYRVGFFNAAEDYNPDEIVVYDDGYDQFTARRIDKVDWIGVDSPDQAFKEARYHIAQQRLRREYHQTTTDIEYLACKQGDLVAFQHDAIAVGIGQARISSVTTVGPNVTAVTLDDGFTMEAGLLYGFVARRVIGAEQWTTSYSVTTVAGVQSSLALNPAVVAANAPSVGDLVSFGQFGVETMRLLLKDIEPRSEDRAVLTMISEAAGVHVADQGPIPPWDPRVTTSFPPPTVLSIRSDAAVMLVSASKTLIPRVVFTIVPSPVGGTTHTVILRPTGTDGQWQDAAVNESSPSIIKITGVDSGITYDFRISRSHPDYLTHPSVQVNGYTVIGRLDPPLGLQNLHIGVYGGQALLAWDLPADLDVIYGGNIKFRHTPLLTGATWPNSTSIGRVITGDQNFAYLPLKSGTYLARVYDADERESLTTAMVTTNQASVLTFVNIGTLQEDPTFGGTKVDCEVASTKLRLVSGDFDSVPDTDALPDWDSAGAGVIVVKDGTYNFSGGLDFTTVSNVRLSSHIKMEAVNVVDLFDSPELFDSPDDFDGVSGAPVDASVWAQTTDDDPAGTPTWRPYQRIDSGEFTCRAVGNIQCRLHTDDGAFNIEISELRLIAEEI